MLSTYSQIVLSGWPAIFKLINKYTRVLLAKKKEAALGKAATPLLSEDQIKEVLMDKQNSFIRYSIATRAKALLALRQISETLELAKQQQMAIEENLEAFRNFLEKQPHQELSVDLHNFEKYQKDINKFVSDLEKKQLLLNRLANKLDEQTYSQEKEWDNFRERWSKKLIQTLEKSGLPLTELEKDEIARPKTVAELVNRIKELGLTLPKGVNL